ncbi:MAG: hypothetical protein ABIQ73_26535 [Acidimicrobiales bacterium]
MKSAARAGAVFVVLFTCGLVGLGDLLGSFADSDHTFVDHFADGGNRAKEIAGSYLLVLAGASFVWFANALAAVKNDRRTPIIVTASLSAGSMIVAGLASMTVPLSISFADLSDDTPFGEGQAVLPQFGSVALTIGAMLPAAAFVIVVARTPSLLPRWLSLTGYPVAALLLVAITVAPMLLFSIWIAAVSVTLWRQRSPIALGQP